jgi:hypothetical protein
VCFSWKEILFFCCKTAIKPSTGSGLGNGIATSHQLALGITTCMPFLASVAARASDFRAHKKVSIGKFNTLLPPWGLSEHTKIIVDLSTWLVLPIGAWI